MKDEEYLDKEIIVIQEEIHNLCHLLLVLRVKNVREEDISDMFADLAQHDDLSNFTIVQKTLLENTQNHSNNNQTVSAYTSKFPSLLKNFIEFQSITTKQNNKIFCQFIVIKMLINSLKYFQSEPSFKVSDSCALSMSKNHGDMVISTPNIDNISFKSLDNLDKCDCSNSEKQQANIDITQKINNTISYRTISKTKKECLNKSLSNDEIIEEKSIPGYVKIKEDERNLTQQIFYNKIRDTDLYETNNSILPQSKEPNKISVDYNTESKIIKNAISTPYIKTSLNLEKLEEINALDIKKNSKSLNEEQKKIIEMEIYELEGQENKIYPNNVEGLNEYNSKNNKSISKFKTENFSSENKYNKTEGIKSRLRGSKNSNSMNTFTNTVHKYICSTKIVKTPNLKDKISLNSINSILDKSNILSDNSPNSLINNIYSQSATYEEFSINTPSKAENGEINFYSAKSEKSKDKKYLAETNFKNNMQEGLDYISKYNPNESPIRTKIHSDHLNKHQKINPQLHSTPYDNIEKCEESKMYDIYDDFDRNNDKDDKINSESKFLYKNYEIFDPITESMEILGDLKKHISNKSFKKNNKTSIFNHKLPSSVENSKKNCNFDLKTNIYDDKSPKILREDNLNYDSNNNISKYKRKQALNISPNKQKINKISNNFNRKFYPRIKSHSRKSISRFKKKSLIMKGTSKNSNQVEKTYASYIIGLDKDIGEGQTDLSHLSYDLEKTTENSRKIILNNNLCKRDGEQISNKKNEIYKNESSPSIEVNDDPVFNEESMKEYISSEYAATSKIKRNKSSNFEFSQKDKIKNSNIKNKENIFKEKNVKKNIKIQNKTGLIKKHDNRHNIQTKSKKSKSCHVLTENIDINNESDRMVDNKFSNQENNVRTTRSQSKINKVEKLGSIQNMKIHNTKKEPHSSSQDKFIDTNKLWTTNKCNKIGNLSPIHDLSFDNIKNITAENIYKNNQNINNFVNGSEKVKNNDIVFGVLNVTKKRTKKQLVGPTKLSSKERRDILRSYRKKSYGGTKPKNTKSDKNQQPKKNKTKNGSENKNDHESLNLRILPRPKRKILHIKTLV